MDMSDNHKAAKLDVLKALRQVAMDLIKEKSEEGSEESPLGHLEKVAVMASNKEGLAKGLDKAQDILGGLPDDEMSEDDESAHLDPSRRAEAIEHEAEESPEEQADEESMLMAKLEALRNKKKMLK